MYKVNIYYDKVIFIYQEQTKIASLPVGQIGIVLLEVFLSGSHHPDGHQLESLLLKPK